MYEPKVIVVTAGIVVVLLIVVALGAILLGIAVKEVSEFIERHF